MNQKLLISLQLLVIIALYGLLVDAKSNFKNDISYILTRLFFLNCSLSIFYYLKKLEGNDLFDFDEIFFLNSNSYNYFHLFWFFNVLLNLGMITNNFSKKFFIYANSYDDWIYIFSMFLSTYIHYALHNRIYYFTQYFSQSSTACIIHFLHYSNSFISFLSYLVINQLSVGDDFYRPLQKLMFFLIFCKFFIILRMPLAGDIGKICYSLVLLFDIKVKLEEIDRLVIEQQNQNQDQNNQNILTIPQVQFLLLLAVVTFLILCFSVYRVYKAWKFLDLNGFLHDRSPMLGDQNMNVHLSSDDQIRQRVKSTDGLNDIELKQLKKTQLEAIQIEPQQSQPSHTCSICFLEIESRSTVYQLGCDHIFHEECLDMWLKNKNSCPNCRSRVIHRTQLIVQNLEVPEMNGTQQFQLSQLSQLSQLPQPQQQSTMSNSQEQQQNIFAQIIRQQELQSVSHLNQDIPRVDEDGEQYFPHQTSMNHIDYDEEAPPRTTDNLNSTSQQEITTAN